MQPRLSPRLRCSGSHVGRLALVLLLPLTACDDPVPEARPVPDAPDEDVRERHVFDDEDPDECGFASHRRPLDLLWSSSDAGAPALDVSWDTELSPELDTPVSVSFFAEAPASNDVAVRPFGAPLRLHHPSRVPLPADLLAAINAEPSLVIHATARRCSVTLAGSETCETEISPELYAEEGELLDEASHRALVRSQWSERRPELFSDATVLSIVDREGR